MINLRQSLVLALTTVLASLTIGCTSSADDKAAMDKANKLSQGYAESLKHWSIKTTPNQAKDSAASPTPASSKQPTAAGNQVLPAAPAARRRTVAGKPSDPNMTNGWTQSLKDWKISTATKKKPE